MAPLGLVALPIRVSHDTELPRDLPQPGRVETSGRLWEHRFGRGAEVVGRSWVPWASTLAWAGDSSPSVRAAAVAVRGPPNSWRVVRPALAAALAPMRSRVRSHPRSRGRDALLGPAAPPASTVASSWSQWPSRRSTSPHRTRTVRPGRHRTGPPGLRWPTRPRPPGRRVARWPAGSNECSSPWRQPINPAPEGKHHSPKCGQPCRTH